MLTGSSQYFISHATGDQAFVKRRLVTMLTELGISPWFSEQHIQTSQQWEREIKSALKSSDGFIVVMSPEAVASEWVKDEVAWAIDNLPGRVFPVLYKTCEPLDIHIRLPRIQCADFRKSAPREEAKFLHLLQTVELAVRSRSATVEGHWRGSIHQPVGPDGRPKDYPMFADLFVNRRDIKGHFTVTFPQDGEVDFVVTGGFLYERFLQLNYYAQDTKAIQFGAITLELDSEGQSMDGAFVGFGSKSKRIVTGTLVLERVPITSSSRPD